MKLDLQTLIFVKMQFDIFGGNNVSCDGYKELCNMIEKIERESKNKDNEVFSREECTFTYCPYPEECQQCCLLNQEDHD